MNDQQLRTWLLETLQNKCDADLELVSEYILALVKNNRSQSELEDELKDFLGEFTGEFVTLLTQQMLNATASTEEIQVDFEEEESESDNERGRSVLASRQLREYSPERPAHEGDGRKEDSKPKRPCTSFQRYGKCRFGETCHFAHVPRAAPRSSRVLVEDLPVELQSPENLVQALKQFGCIVAVHVEGTKATIQFSNADEAEAVIKADSIAEGVKVSLLQKQPTLKPTPSNLPALLELQKKQQSLLTRCIADQKTLLGELESSELGEEEKNSRFAALAKIQSNCGNVQQMLKSTTQMILDEKARLEREPPAKPTKKLPYKPHHHQQQQRSFAKAPASRSLDLRPSTLRLSSLDEALIGPSKGIHALQRFFSPFGSILSLRMAEGGEAAIVKFQRHEDAKRAYDGIKAKNCESITWEEQ